MVLGRATTRPPVRALAQRALERLVRALQRLVRALERLVRAQPALVVEVQAAWARVTALPVPAPRVQAAQPVPRERPAVRPARRGPMPQALVSALPQAVAV